MLVPFTAHAQRGMKSVRVQAPSTPTAVLTRRYLAARNVHFREPPLARGSGPGPVLRLLPRATGGRCSSLAVLLAADSPVAVAAT